MFKRLATIHSKIHYKTAITIAMKRIFYRPQFFTRQSVARQLPKPKVMRPLRPIPGTDEIMIRRSYPGSVEKLDLIYRGTNSLWMNENNFITFTLVLVSCNNNNFTHVTHGRAILNERICTMKTRLLINISILLYI